MGARSRLDFTLTYVGVMLFMMVIITYRFTGLPAGDIAVAMALIGLVTDRQGIVFPRSLVFLIVFLAWCWLGTYSTRFPGPSQDATLQLTKTGLIWWTALAAIRSRAQFRWAMILLVFLYATHPVRGGIMNILVYNHAVFGRVIWNHIFSNPNDYAAFTMLFLSIAAGLVVTERRGLIWWGAVASCFVFPIIMIFTQSRANFIGLGFFGLAVFVGQKKKAKGLVALAVFMAAAAVTVPSAAWERLGGVADLGSTESARQLDSSANERIEIWRVAVRVVKDNFATGTGLGTYDYAHHETVTLNRDEFPYFIGLNTFRDAHSTYLTVLAETGVPGMLLWMAAVGSVIVYAETRRRRFGVILPQAARQLLFLEYGLAAYGIAAIWGSYATHAFLYLHLTWIWVAAALLEKDARAFRASLAAGTPPGQGRRGAPPQRNGGPHRPVAGSGMPAPRARPAFDPARVGYPVQADPSSTS